MESPQPYCGDVAGKPGIVACGVCQREQPRQPDGHTPEGWEVVCEPWEDELITGTRFYFICENEES